MTAETGHSIVVIHGLYGSGKELAEDASDSWTHQYLKSFDLGSRLMLFEWKSYNIFAGVETGSSVKALSRCLLQGLANVGGEKTMVCISKAPVLVLELTEECFRGDPSCSWLMILDL